MGFEMKFTRLLLSAWVGFGIVCGNASADLDLFASKELQINNAIPDEADLTRNFEDPLPALLRDQQLVQLANCSDYLAVRSRIIGSDNEPDYQALIFQTVPCSALALLKTATIAKQSALPKNFHDYRTTSAYPATLWPAISEDERKSKDWATGTLSSYTQQSTLNKIGEDALGLEKSGYGLRITLLARGDFNHDGWEDAAFRWEGYALKSSYADSRLVILTRVNADSPLQEIPSDSSWQNR